MTERVILYDGLCSLCDGFVRWVLKQDRTAVYRFAPLQGETAAAIKSRHPEIQSNLDSIILCETATRQERVYWKSAAVAQILDGLNRPIAARLLRMLPVTVANAGYDLVAACRSRLMGRLSTCPLPSPSFRDRFLP